MDTKRQQQSNYYIKQTSEKPGSEKQYRLKILFRREGSGLVQSELNKIKDTSDPLVDAECLKRKTVLAISHYRGSVQEDIKASKSELCIDVYGDGTEHVHARLLEAENVSELILTGTSFELLEHFIEPLVEAAWEYIIIPETWELLSEIWN